MNRRASLAVPALAALATIASVVHDRLAPAADAKRTVVLFLGLCALALSVSRGRTSAKATRSHAAWTCALAFVALSMLSALWGAPAGLLDLGTWVGAAAFAIAVRSRSIHGRRESVLIARGTALGLGGVSSVIALAAYARSLRGFSLHGGQGNPNWLGLLLAVTLPLSLEATMALASARSSRSNVSLLSAFSTLSALVATLVQVPAMVLAHSRVAWVAASVAITFMLVLKLQSRVALHRTRRVVAVSALVTVALLSVVLARPSTTAPAEPGVPTGSGEATPLDSLRGRWFLARVSSTAALRALPFGVGLGRFGHAYLEAQGDALAMFSPREAARRFLNATTAHDDWLQAAIESGPLSLAALLATFALGIVALARARLPGESAALVACAIGAVGDSPLRQPAIVVLIALVLATLPGRKRTSPNRPPRSQGHARRLVLESALLLACALLLASSARSYIAARLRTEAIDAPPETRLSLLSRSVRVDRGSGESALELGLARLETGDPDGALIELMRSRRLLANVGTSIAIGNTELALSRPDLAEVSYREALAYHPGSMRAHANLGDTLRILGRFDEAERHASIALQLSPGDARIQALIDRIHLEKMDSSTQ